MKDHNGYTAIYYGLSEEDAQNYGDKHAKPYGFKYVVTKEGTPNRPYVLWALMEKAIKETKKRTPI